MLLDCDIVITPSLKETFTPARFFVPGEFKHHWDGRRWCLDRDLVCWDGKSLIRIPRGFRWDGASVPRLFRWYEGKGDHLIASCIHDWIYQYHRVLVYCMTTDEWIWMRAGKVYADRMWRKVLIHVYDVRLSKVLVLWESVHVCGWPAYLSKPCNALCGACPVYGAKANGLCPVYDVVPFHCSESV